VTVSNRLLVIGAKVSPYLSGCSVLGKDLRINWLSGFLSLMRLNIQ
jgi:hypothetical protein